MKKKVFALFFVAVALVSCKKEEKAPETEKTPLVVSDTLKWSERMAQTLMHHHPEAYQIDDKTEPKWDYVHGLVMTSFEKLYQKTHKKEYFDYVKGYADATINEDGTIVSYEMEKYNIDMIEAGNSLFFLYNQTKDERYLKAIQLLREQLKNHPRTTEGGFWHKKVYPNQMWLDGLFMGPPFYAQYTATYEEGAALDDVAKQFELIQKHLVDPKTNLLYHGWDESKEMEWANKETGTSPNFWSRSLGWYAMALVDALDYFPENHPKRAELVQYLNQLAEALVKFQDKTGLWYQVTDKGGSEGNYLESSGSSMFAYAMAKGVNKGYLPMKFKAIANKAFDGSRLSASVAMTIFIP